MIAPPRCWFPARYGCINKHRHKYTEDTDWDRPAKWGSCYWKGYLSLSPLSGSIPLCPPAMSLGRTGTMWLIQPHTHTHKHTLMANATRAQSKHTELYQLACCGQQAESTSRLMTSPKQTRKRKPRPFRFPSDIYSAATLRTPFILRSVTLSIAATIIHFSEALH